MIRKLSITFDAIEIEPLIKNKGWYHIDDVKVKKNPAFEIDSGRLSSLSMKKR